MPAKLTTESAIIGFTKIHGNRYIYDKSVYQSPFCRLVITCRIHGEFTQTQNQHKRGANCPSCAAITAARTRNKGFENWLQRVNRVHNFLYQYQKPTKFRADCIIKICCIKHGFFTQLAYDHLRGQGCPLCSDGGFNRLKRAYLYLLISNDFQMIKIGITGNIERRMNKLKIATPFAFFKLCAFSGKGEHIFNLERMIHRTFANCGMKGFDGATEWLMVSGQIEEIFNVISQSEFLSTVDDV